MITAEIQKSEGGFSLTWGGDLEGVCCAAQERALLKKLAELGIEATQESVQCHLPRPHYQRAVREKKCIKIDLKEEVV